MRRTYVMIRKTMQMLCEHFLRVDSIIFTFNSTQFIHKVCFAETDVFETGNSFIISSARDRQFFQRKNYSRLLNLFSTLQNCVLKIIYIKPICCANDRFTRIKYVQRLKTCNSAINASFALI